jgi:putative membrane protein insertion efficiency factor
VLLRNERTKRRIGRNSLEKFQIIAILGRSDALSTMTDPAPAQAALANLTRCVRSAPRIAGRGLIKVYRYSLSPLIGFHCRHLPTCSEYGDDALHRHGLWAGGWMTLGRLCRCHPYGTSGLDFVPAEPPARARWYLPWRYARWRSTNETPPGTG